MRTVLSSVAVVWAVAAVAGAQAPPPSIAQGVYTAAQADRGKAVFTTNCLRCHGADLAGNTAPALKGERFFATWGGDSVSRLFEKIRDTMPPFVGATLDGGAKLDVVAFILQSNGYPAGKTELVQGSGLAAIQILRAGEQIRVQNFSLVQAIGCLARSDTKWMLRQSSSPAATTDSAPSDSALAAAASVPLGSADFELLSALPFNPASNEGRKVEVRGLIYQESGEALLTVTSLKSVGSCSSAPTVR